MDDEQDVEAAIAAAVARYVALGYTLDEITVERDIEGEYPTRYMVTARRDDPKP